MTAAERTRLTERLAKIDSIISTLYDAMLNFDNIQGYTFDSGEGRQATTYRSTKEIHSTIRELEASAALIRRRLNGTANPGMNLRRKTGTYHGGRRGYC